MECPVCREPLDGRPERCFRCETRLAPWWDFEGTLARAGHEEVPASPVPVPEHTSSSKIGVAAALLGGIAFGAATAWGVAARDRSDASNPGPDASTTVTVTPPAPPPTLARAKEPAPQPVTYRVQRGDSLWRLAKAFTGEGRRWRELWPERAHGHLTQNEVLVIPQVSERP